MLHTSRLTQAIASILAGTLAMPSVGWAAQLTFATYPAGSASREPAPNVIVSVDDSGSMGTAGIQALKDALKSNFSAMEDDRIRLAWQSMNRCNGIPSNSTACGSKNSLRSFSGIHRTNFLTWVDTLVPGNGTPAHMMVRNAGDYLMTTGVNSPWNRNPGTADSSPIACRKAFHIFMTDGGWNSSEPTNTTNHIDGDRKKAGYTVKGVGNVDGTTMTLGDGTTYTANANSNKIYYDAWGFGGTDGLNTISDLSFYYWATDLQPNIANSVKPKIKKVGTETFGTGSTAKTVPEFWNPRNDPATWQHMQTYTIGFGAGASAWTGTPTFGTDTHTGGSYAALHQGTVTWPSPLCSNNNTGSGNMACDGGSGYSVRDNERRIELWHSAINGRGKFVPATDASALTAAFQEILGGIIADTSAPVTSFTSASSSVKRSATEEFVSGYDAAKWTGYVKSNVLAQGNGSASANPAWGINPALTAPNNHRTTADKLDALTAVNISNRLILTTNDASNAGVSFEWATDTTKLSAAQKTLMKTLRTTVSADSVGEDRVNFIRGDRTKEGTSVAAPYRERGSRQGDIVNSSLWYVGQPISNYAFESYGAYAALHKARLPMIYVGGNDGMLHGFSAVDGNEKIAYIPQGVVKNLPFLSDPGYVHQYFVDGSAFTGDVNLNATTPDWRTLLVGTLGVGGKGYFVLDVTKPGTTAATGGIASNFTVANASTLVVMDKTFHKDDVLAGDAADIGFMTSNPVVDDANPQKVTQIVRMNNGRWAAVMGNGYNSTNERPVLLIQYLDGDKTLRTIPAAAIGSAKAVSNGLSTPRLVDINGDGTPDVVYAGDLQGNMWKFNVAAADSTTWGVAFSGAPLYTATYTANGSASSQPITAPPVVKTNDRGIGGLMVAFGTGRNLTEGDRTDVSKQTIYSVLDNTRYKISGTKVVIDTDAATPTAVGTGVSNLVEQTLTSTTALAGSGASATRKFWNLSQNVVNYTGTGAKKGWYFHLPETGERILDAMTFFDGSNILEVISEVPGSGGNLDVESCDPPSKPTLKYRTFLNIMDGKKPSVQIIDLNGDGYFNAAASQDKGVSRMTASTEESRFSGDKTEKRSGSDGVNDDLAKMPEQPMRPSWRQLQ